MNRDEKGRFVTTEQKEATSMPYGFWSKLLNKPFDSVEELETAEHKYIKEQNEQALKLSAKKERAKEVEEAYKHSQEVRKEASKMIKEADDKYFALRDAFIKDYHSFHMSFYNDGDKERITVGDFITTFFDNYLFK